MISRRRFTTGLVIALTPLGSTASAQEYKAQQRVRLLADFLVTRPKHEERYVREYVESQVTAEKVTHLEKIKTAVDKRLDHDLKARLDDLTREYRWGDDIR